MKFRFLQGFTDKWTKSAAYILIIFFLFIFLDGQKKIDRVHGKREEVECQILNSDHVPNHQTRHTP